VKESFERLLTLRIRTNVNSCRLQKPRAKAADEYPGSRCLSISIKPALVRLRFASLPLFQEINADLVAITHASWQRRYAKPVDENSKKNSFSARPLDGAIDSQPWRRRQTHLPSSSCTAMFHRSPSCAPGIFALDVTVSRQFGERFGRTQLSEEELR
jgi:hypothetical protein